jgi:hypothetical protein
MVGLTRVPRFKTWGPPRYTSLTTPEQIASTRAWVVRQRLHGHMDADTCDATLQALNACEARLQGSQD